MVPDECPDAPQARDAKQHPARRRSETNVVVSWPVALRHGERAVA